MMTWPPRRRIHRAMDRSSAGVISASAGNPASQPRLKPKESDVRISLEGLPTRPSTSYSILYILYGPVSAGILFRVTPRLSASLKILDADPHGIFAGLV